MYSLNSGILHYEVHKSLDGFWNQYRKEGALCSSKSINLHYSALGEMKVSRIPGKIS